MATASSSNPGGLGSQSIRRRVGYRLPDIQSVVISSSHGSALADEELHSVARALSRLDRFLLSYCAGIYEQMRSGRLNRDDAATQQQALNDLDEIEKIHDQFREITTGQYVFSSRYLSERRFLYYWGLAFSFFAQVLMADGEVHQPTLGHLKRVADLAADLERTLHEAALVGVLVPDYRLILSDRWELLEDALELYHQHSQVPRVVAKWSTLAPQLQRAMKAHSTNPAAQDVDAVPQPIPGVFTTMLWSTFIVTALFNVWTFALAYHYSEHAPGSTKDADFWFLVQGCITQVFTLVTSSIPLKAELRLQKRTWVPPTVVALICTFIAPPLYLAIPTEWANFVLLIASGIQAFMILQLVSIGKY